MILKLCKAVSKIQSQGVHNSNQSVDIEEHEHLLCVNANTVIDPGAVMVHECYASVAVVAVMS